MNILVTGGGKFIDSLIVDKLVGYDHFVEASITRSDKCLNGFILLNKIWSLSGI